MIRKTTLSFVLDEALKASPEHLLVHPLHNQATLAISLADLLKFFKSYNRVVKWVDFSQIILVADVVDGKAAVPKETKVKDAVPAAVIGAEQLGITATKEAAFSEWYTQVITRSDMVEYYDISGCYILRPWSYFMWESIQDFMNIRIKKLGVQNCYFPMFVSKNKLEAEKDHVEGFSPEVAWVTKYGDSELAEPIAIRPTSETIMYPSFAKWIRSHRDLPLKLNQWCQVVRWEFKQPTPFIRTREFLWQEGHTAHATDEDAEKTVMQILDIYAAVYEELLAIPVVKGIKSEKEKFAGGKMTTTVETLIAENGRGVQAATSHHLGQNFSKMFGIEFEDKDRQRQLAHQTSWGLSTRSLGVAVMIHGDDKGMVMPPRCAPVQVVIVPIVYKEACSIEMIERCNKIAESLTEIGVRVKVDDRDNYTPGWKYNDWETKGVCIRMEIGPRDMKSETARLVKRHNGDKSDHRWSELVAVVPTMLEDIHNAMFKKAKDSLDGSITKVSDFSEVMPILNEKKLILAPWCEDPATEEEIKKETTRLSLVQQEETTEEGCAPALTGAMKSLCIPLDQPPMPEGTKCFFTGKPAKRWCLFGRSY
ncbi:LOW QUALITY PROTEIN: uncharacterized protein LOC129616798 [Condylostylus longicornis]|uniref:LOW QUALITY PROTEIN: uncharacterized protein LOC129616798 n=1 Tax=Condylostylus longicornis TaxID=2530218 RepID=UPI00244E0B37|nr:LOW QUALITY PROTEIN: uncharacterized protein LOC129616798 [Condylostylus longicornis]